MSNFEMAIPVILKAEGGWVSDPSDLGGETNFGISTLIIQREHITPEFLGLDPATAFQAGWLKPMKVDAAQKVYRQLFWDKYKYGNIADQQCATKIFDCAVNCGPSRSHTMAQNAANTSGSSCAVDGVMGPGTAGAINACNPKIFMTNMCAEMAKYYTNIIAARPANAKFKNNWMKRAAWGAP